MSKRDHKMIVRPRRDRRIPPGRRLRRQTRLGDQVEIERLLVPLETVNVIEPLAELAKLIEKGNALTPRQRFVAAGILNFVSAYVTAEQRRVPRGRSAIANTDINARVANVLYAEFKTSKNAAAAAAVTDLRGTAAAVDRVVKAMQRLNNRHSLLHQVLDAVRSHGDTFRNRLIEAACRLKASPKDK